MPEVLIIGTTHLNMPDNGDVLMPNTTDILGEKRQDELDEFIDRLSKFDPTKICLEVSTREQASLNKRYQDYLANSLSLSEDEREQVGFRLAKMCDLSSVQSVDWNDSVDGVSLSDVMESHQLEMELILQLQRELMCKIETVFHQNSINDFYSYINQQEITHFMHQAYLDIAALGPAGANWIESYWYYRNHKIYNTVVQNSEISDRIVILYGLAHAHLLHKYFEEDDNFIVHKLEHFLY